MLSQEEKEGDNTANLPSGLTTCKILLWLVDDRIKNRGNLQKHSPSLFCFFKKKTDTSLLIITNS